MGRALAGLLGLLLAAPAGAAAPNAQSPLGINLPWLNRTATDWPLIDEMKRADVLTQTASIWDTGELDRVDFDANGWPRSLRPKDGGTATFDRVSYLLFGAGGDAPAPPPGDFHVHWEGEGTLEYFFGAQKVGSCGQRCDVVHIDPSQLVDISITATDPQGTGDYLRNIQVIWPGGICNGDFFTWHRDASTCQGNYRSFDSLRHLITFHPDFLRDLRRFATLRFMDWQHTNHLPVTWPYTYADLLALPAFEWADRATRADARWGNADRRGAPVEVMVELANILGAEPWFSMPVHASDDYVRQFARFVRDHLDPALTAHVEYGNEHWNSQFATGALVEARGLQQWPAANPYDARMNWHAKRTVEICDLWRAEWGGRAGQVDCVMGAHNDNPGLTRYTLMDCTLWRDDARNPHKGTACGSLVDSLAIAPYFGGHVGQPANEATVTAWTQQADGGLNALFNELQNGGTLPVSGSQGAIAEAMSGVAAHRQIANDYGLHLLAYEAGQHLAGVGSVTDNAAVVNLFKAANRDPRMGQLYSDYLAAWRTNGGERAALYLSVGPYNKWGAWGLKEHQAQAASAKWDAVQAFLDGNACWWSGCGPGGGRDGDGDGVTDWLDVCSAVADWPQRDTDRDGYGNACDADLDNDGSVAAGDLTRFRSAFLTADANADLDGDGHVNFADLARLRAGWGQPPGPSGLASRP